VTDDVLLFETVGRVARVTLNRPKAMNALNGQLIQQFEDVLDRIIDDDEIRVLLMTGQGAAFCAGADLKEALHTQPIPGEPDFLKRAGSFMNRLRDFPKPVIAALNGTTMAGGLELALCADIILAADTVQIGDAHANYGVYPGAGGAAVLPRRLPLNTALYMLLTGKTLPASRLYELGLVAELHPAPQLAAAALELATDIAAKSPLALTRMKVVAKAAADKSQADALLHEQVMLREHLQSQDMQEGLLAFTEKRPPRFTGR
jgi:enoyl-CoA hydratase/carnithine racemase